MSDEVLDAPTFLSERAAFWSRALTEERWAHMRVAVSEHEGRISGVAVKFEDGIREIRMRRTAI